MRCGCAETRHEPKKIVITGGPGAGKTAVLEVVRKDFCSHVLVLPESASMLFGGGFPRSSTPLGRNAAQRAIFTVQRELERVVEADVAAAMILCDRGTLDSAAYCMGDPDEFLAGLGTSRHEQLTRYAGVIHLRPPGADNGYLQSSIRTESAAEAHAIDLRIEAAWAGHPHRHFVASTTEFLDKLVATIRVLRDQVPTCCRPPVTDAASVRGVDAR